MTMIRTLLAATAAIAFAAPTLAVTYGDTLIAATQARHRDLASVAIDASGKAGAIRVAGGAPAAYAVTRPLTDSMGQPIGSVRLSFRRESDTVGGPAIAAEMSRRIYVADNLMEADPFVPGTARSPFAQALVDRMIDANPDLVTLAMHVTPPGQATNIIIASNFGRIGKAGDKDDMHVINDEAVLKEVTNGGKRLAVSLPMHDMKGTVIGSLSTSFTMQSADDEARVESRAVAVRDALAAATPSIQVLAARR